MQTHLEVAHQWLQDQLPRRPRLRPRNTRGGLFEEFTRPIYCQIFHKESYYSFYFEVRYLVLAAKAQHHVHNYLYERSWPRSCKKAGERQQEPEFSSALNKTIS